MPRTLKHIATAAVLTVTLATAGCYGQFALTRKVYTWNGQVTNSPVGNSLIMWGLIIIPVYPLSTLGDILIFNVIEFFNGQNPMAINGDGSLAVRRDGHDYRFEKTKDGAVEVGVDGKPVIRYRKQANAIEIENLRRGRFMVVPLGRAQAQALSGHVL